MFSLQLIWSVALLQQDTGEEAKLLNSGKHGPLKREHIQRNCHESFAHLRLLLRGHIETSSYISTSVVIVQWYVAVYLIRHGRQKSTSMARWALGSKENV